MKKTIKITLLESAKLLKKREFLLGLVMVLVMGGGMAYGAYMFPESFGVQNVIAFFGNFSSILIMFLAAKSLGEDFDLKTATFVFTSRSGRLQIITAKIVSIALANMVIGFCGGILYDIALVICRQSWTVPMLFGTLGKEILIYMIYGFAIGATAVMLTCFHNTTITPFIYLIVLFWVMPGILQMIGQKITGLEKIMDYVLFCISDQFLMYQVWSIKNIAVFIVTGIAFSIVGMAVLQKKDL
jgi:ABC-type transport system involved in multi-copper enzyme maturation permease subunit